MVLSLIYIYIYSIVFIFRKLGALAQSSRYVVLDGGLHEPDHQVRPYLFAVSRNVPKFAIGCYSRCAAAL